MSLLRGGRTLRGCVQSRKVRKSTSWNGEVGGDQVARSWRVANPESYAAIIERRREKVLASAPHVRGKVAWYTLGCPCDGCTAAEAKSKQSRRSRA